MLVEALLVLMCGGSGLGAGILFFIALFFYPNLFATVSFLFGICVWSLILATIWCGFRSIFPSKAERKEREEKYERERKAGMFYDGR